MSALIKKDMVYKVGNPYELRDLDFDDPATIEAEDVRALFCYFFAPLQLYDCAIGAAGLRAACGVGRRRRRRRRRGMRSGFSCRSSGLRRRGTNGS